MTSEVITRFAPSPTGYLHLGHVLAALEAFGFASKHGGKCLLRIEDIDYTRCKPEYSRSIENILGWLGFRWPEPARVQSQHIEDYEDVITALAEKGLIYRCFKQRRKLPNGLYRGTPDTDEHARIEDGDPYAWRLSIPACTDFLGTSKLSYYETGTEQKTVTVDIAELNDEVVARRDIETSYLIACTHDDAIQNISHVVRGHDISDLTAYQVLIQKLMRWPTPIYHHHPLIMAADGKKLSKRNQDTAIHTLRAQGVTAQAILDMASI